MTEVSSSVAQAVAQSEARIDSALQAAGVVDGVESASLSKWYRWRQDGTALAKYLLDSEVHTFAFSVAANVILSFLPFIVLLYALASSVFHSPTMVIEVTAMVQYFIPSDPTDLIGILERATVSRHGLQLFSLVMILISCTGIFLPLEVALNQAWGVTKSRNYIMNQIVAFGLVLLMVALGTISLLITTGARELLTLFFFHHTNNFVFNGINYLLLAVTTGVASILFFFSIYWLLPNRKVPWKPVLRTSVVTGLIWLAAKFVFQEILPLMHLEDLYGGFHVSVGLIFWAYFSGLILFAGAQFSVARLGDKARD